MVNRWSVHHARLHHVRSQANRPNLGASGLFGISVQLRAARAHKPDIADVFHLKIHLVTLVEVRKLSFFHL